MNHYIWLFFKALLKLHLIWIIPDKFFISVRYREFMGKNMNWANPTTYNEKIQWLKLYDHNPQYPNMVDKYEAKKYISSIVGEQYVIPTLGVWEKFDDIDFSNLPNQFVLKCTHDSGGLVICKDKNNFDIASAKAKINKSLANNYFYHGREWPYKYVKPRIIAEEYMEDENTGELRDYKFFSFNGNTVALFIATDRQKSSETCFDFFDMNFEHLNIRNGHPNALIAPSKPHRFDEMKNLADKLSDGLPHVRVDFYEVNGKVYVGELTFAHWSGMIPFEPEAWDEYFGKFIDLSMASNISK